MPSTQRRATAPPAPPADSLWPLTRQLVHAGLLAAFDRVPVPVINRIIAGCALYALVAPLLLWISWSKAGFLIIVGSALTAVAIIYLLVRLYPDDPY